jgi:hypothetical protein
MRRFMMSWHPASLIQTWIRRPRTPSSIGPSNRYSLIFHLNHKKTCPRFTTKMTNMMRVWISGPFNCLGGEIPFLKLSLRRACPVGLGELAFTVSPPRELSGMLEEYFKYVFTVLSEEHPRTPQAFAISYPRIIHARLRRR